MALEDGVVIGLENNEPGDAKNKDSYVKLSYAFPAISFALLVAIIYKI